MEAFPNFYLPIVYTSIGLFFILTLTRLTFFYKLKEFTKNKNALRDRFPIPNFVLFCISTLLLVCSLIFATISLFQTEANEVEISDTKNSVDILFIIDVSLSMNAVDVYPNRLKRAQDIITRLAPDLAGNRVGMIVFAGSAFSFCPMTTDLTAFADYVSSLGVDMIGRKGTDLSRALEKASSMLSSTKLFKNRIVVFVSDGEDHESSMAKKIDAELQVWGIGTSEGAPIYFGDANSKTAGYVTKSGGLSPNDTGEDLIVSRLMEKNLQALAETNNGQYYDLTREAIGAYKLIDKIESMKKNQTILLEQVRREDGAGTFLVLALICFFMERFLRFFYLPKKVTFLVLGILLASLQSNPIYSWELDPGGNRVKEGVNAYEGKNFLEAESKFKEAETYIGEDARLNFNQGNTDYMLGHYQDAIKKNQKIIEDPNSSLDLKAKALYNNGNAFFKLKDLKAAQKHYEDALGLNPNHRASKKNLELLHRKKERSNSKPEEGNPERKNPSEQKNESSGTSNQKSQKQSNEEKNAKENADRMMDHFAPDSILRKKPNGGGSVDNDKFW
jgi:Ca-activated chloride channel family protein